MTKSNKVMRSKSAIAKTKTSEIPKEIQPAAQPTAQDFDALDIIERRNAYYNKLLSVAISCTSDRDWIDESGNPFLLSSGSEKVGRRLGLSVGDVIQECENFEDEKGKHYIYTTMGRVSLPGNNDSIECIGTCSSRDKFFGKVRGEYRNISDVDRTNIKKKSYTNFFGNGVRKLLGLNNLTWEDLGRAGITREGKTTVSRNKAGSDQPRANNKASENKSKKPPFWEKTFDDGRQAIFAKTGSTFPVDFLIGLGMKESAKTPGLFWSNYSQSLYSALQTTAKNGFIEGEGS